MKTRTPAQHLHHLNRKQHKIRLPHGIYSNEQQINLFFYHLNELPLVVCKNIFSDTQQSFIWILEKDHINIGIELPFRKIEHFRKTDPVKANILENLLDKLIEKYYVALEDKLKNDLTGINYSRADFKELLYQYLTQENREAIVLRNNALNELLHNNSNVREAIKKYFQQGHPTLINSPRKTAYIGGDLNFDAANNVWLIRNKSGRYGRSISNGLDTLYIQTVHLLKVQCFLQKRGIAAKAFIYYKPCVSVENLKLFYALVNEGLENYFNTEKFTVSANSLSQLNDRESALFNIGLQHIENYIRTINQPKPEPNALILPEVQREQKRAFILDQYGQKVAQQSHYFKPQPPRPIANYYKKNFR